MEEKKNVIFAIRKQIEFSSRPNEDCSRYSRQHEHVVVHVYGVSDGLTLLVDFDDFAYKNETASH